ncbi:MAG: 6-phosphofructokinase [Bacteroidota bacterium]
MRRIAVFTSGGDAPGMNACIRAVTRTALANNLQVYGILRGYQGMIEDEFKPLTSRSVSNILQRGGTIFKAARSKAFLTQEGRARAYQNLKNHQIDGLVAIGGDGTFSGAEVFTNEYPDIKIIGVPGTIDNDLSGTDFTLGFDTALNTVVDAVDKIKDTAASHDRCFLIEVMGRDAGCLALWAAVAGGAEMVMLPEKVMSVDDLMATLENAKQHKKSSTIVIVAEGEKNGGAQAIAAKMKEHFEDYETRVTVLGHIQRGGKPSAFDRILAARLGVSAVEHLLNGNSKAMVGIRNNVVALTPFAQAIKNQNPLDENLFAIANILSI